MIAYQDLKNHFKKWNEPKSDRRQIFEVMDYQIHPNFRTETTTRNDIALLEWDLITGIHVL